MLFLTILSILLLLPSFQSLHLHNSSRQIACTSDITCNAGLTFPLLTCTSNQCLPSSSLSFIPSSTSTLPSRPTNAQCTSIKECSPGLVCVSGNPIGVCRPPEGVLGLGHLLQNLIQMDYTFPSNVGSVEPEQQGPTRASRALALSFLAAHDTYAELTGAFSAKSGARGLSRRGKAARAAARGPEGVRLGLRDARIYENQAGIAAVAAGLKVAMLLYPRSKTIIRVVRQGMIRGGFESFVTFGDAVGRIWVKSRRNDGSAAVQTDTRFGKELLRHQPDPNFELVTGRPGPQGNFGRNWAKVKGFIVKNVEREAFLGGFPNLLSREYIRDMEEVMEKGQCNNLKFKNGRSLKDIGVYWGYDGMAEIGVPPRLYLQVVLAVQELELLPFANQLRAMTGVTVAMVDAGIAAWVWKFQYDLWRPVVGIRFDPRGQRNWSPIGVAFSNLGERRVPECSGLNPDFPAYPSGHASFGTAAFRTVAGLLGKDPNDVRVTFTSDELNGKTTDGATGKIRDVFTQTISLEEAIEQNKDARVFLGVHWRFDSEGGDVVGTKVARKVIREFAFV